VPAANLELHVSGPFNLARLSAATFAADEPDPDADGQRGVIVQTASISEPDPARSWPGTPTGSTRSTPDRGG
jgi:hypothetical protein